MKLLILALSMSLTASTAWASGYVLAKEISSLHPRSTFQGGWPIEATTCPSNTTSCDTTGACCPGSTNCYTDGLSGDAVCCPTTDNCYDTAKAVPICADPTWTLYNGNYNPFCCAKGQIGILPNSADTVKSGLCVASDTTVAATARASTVGAASAPTSTQSHGIVSAIASHLANNSPTSSAGKAIDINDLAKSSLISIVGLIVGCLVIPLRM